MKYLHYQCMASVLTAVLMGGCFKAANPDDSGNGDENAPTDTKGYTDTETESDLDSHADTDSDAESDLDSDWDSEWDSDTETIWGVGSPCSADLGNQFRVWGVCGGSKEDCPGGTAWSDNPVLGSDHQGTCRYGLFCCINTDQCEAVGTIYETPTHCQALSCEGKNVSVHFGCPNQEWCCESPDSNTDSDTDTAPHEDPELIIFEGFENYGVNTAISKAPSEFNWVLWPDAIDGIVSDFVAYEGQNALSMNPSADNVLMLEFENGTYEIEFMMNIPQFGRGYYNFQAHYTGDPDSNVWAFEVYLDDYNGGRVEILDHFTRSFSYSGSGTWIKISHYIDLNQDFAILKINDQLIGRWIYSLPQGPRSDGIIDGINFYAEPHYFRPFRIDNIKVWKIR